MVDEQQVAVEVQVALLARLDGRVGGLLGDGAGREGQLGVDGKGRQGDAGEALGGELGLVDDDLLDVRVRGLVPVGGEGGHDGQFDALAIGRAGGGSWLS